MTNKRNFNKPTLNKALLMVLSFLCSLMLWVYVTETEGEDYSETFSDVKVSFEGEETMRESKGLIVTSLDTTTVRVSISGSRRTVANLEAEDLTAVIDLSTISKTGNHSPGYKILYPSGVDESSLKVESRSPQNISFYVDRLDTETVEVKGIFNGSAAEGYSAEPLEFNPGTVKISGPASALEQVAYAWVVVDRENVDKTLTFESTYQLMDDDGNVVENEDINLEADTVSVTLPIISIKDVDLVLDFIPGGGATDANVKYSIEPKQITLSGDSATLAGLNKISLEKIDLSTVADSFTATYPIVIPNDTEIIGNQKEATVKLEIFGLDTKKVSISAGNISCTNVTDGFTAEIISGDLDNVVIRGKESVLRGISEANIRAIADLTDYGTATGILSVPVEIRIDGTTEAGAIGEYTVYVDVKKQ